jgi:hypothetical protein
MKFAAIPYALHRHYCAHCFDDVGCPKSCTAPAYADEHLWGLCANFGCHVWAALRRHDLRLEQRRREALKRLTDAPGFSGDSRLGPIFSRNTKPF